MQKATAGLEKLDGVYVTCLVQDLSSVVLKSEIQNSEKWIYILKLFSVHSHMESSFFYF